MNQYTAQLLAERSEIVAALEEGNDEPVVLDQTKVGRLSRMDAMQAQALARNVVNRRRERLVAIAKALQRIDEDEFGYCQSCGGDMDPRRLQIDPTAEYCISCAEKQA